MRLLVVGTSATAVCGVRDCAATLAPALEAAGAEVETDWWERDSADGPRRTLRTASRWMERVATATAQADAILWHYTCFSYGPRGLPLAVPSVARALGASRTPVVGFLHELAYPWRTRGWRGGVQAATQRLALERVVRRLAGVVVTEDARGDWLAARRWLPGRPTLAVPVHSNVPVVAKEHDRNGAAPTVGIFGFAAETPDIDATVGAIASLRREGLPAELILIGAPGPASPQAQQWRSAAAAAGVRDGLAFTGVLPVEEVSRALARLDVVLLPDRGGPSSRRGTLAAALAHGKAVVAVDGPHRWSAGVRDDAFVVSQPGASELATRIGELLRQPELRRAQGERAREFYERAMAPSVTAPLLLDFIAEAGATRRHA